MKITMVISLFLGCLFFSTITISDDEVQKIVEDKSKKQTVEKKEKKKRRRKKVLMCNDCGKPETECDCEGHNH